ncbi:MAG: sigma factor-like helix-turn-helix DNA-binding protein, partial [Candidatus Binatia bacterium]
VEDQIEQTVAFEPPIPTAITDEDILRSLERVPKNYREVVLLADVEEFSYKEIAQLLLVPIGTVMSRLHRGRRLLRQELTGYARKIRLVGEG